MFKHFRVKMLILAFCFISQNNIAQETETRNLASFDRISSIASIDVIIVQGNAHTVRIESENIATDKILTETKNGLLTISMQKGNYWNARAKVIVTLPYINAIHLSGTGNVISESPIKGKQLEVQLTSSGNITINLLIVDQLTVKLYGTGDMQFGGSADACNIKLSGSGDIQAFGLKTLRCQAEIIGSGNIKVLALEAIDAYVTGSGDISYKGNPNSERTKSSGPGGIIAIR